MTGEIRGSYEEEKEVANEKKEWYVKLSA